MIHPRSRCCNLSLDLSIVINLDHLPQLPFETVDPNVILNLFTTVLEQVVHYDTCCLSLLHVGLTIVKDALVLVGNAIKVGLVPR